MRCHIFGIIYFNSNLTDSHFSFIFTQTVLHGMCQQWVGKKAQNGTENRLRRRKTFFPFSFLPSHHFIVSISFIFLFIFWASAMRETTICWLTSLHGYNTKLKNPVYKDERKTLWKLFTICPQYSLCAPASFEIVIRSVTNAELTQSKLEIVQCGSPLLLSNTRRTTHSMFDDDVAKVETLCIMFFFPNFWPLLRKWFFPYCFTAKCVARSPKKQPAAKKYSRFEWQNFFSLF